MLFELMLVFTYGCQTRTLRDVRRRNWSLLPRRVGWCWISGLRMT